jgi:hypothetical protein
MATEGCSQPQHELGLLRVTVFAIVEAGGGKRWGEHPVGDLAPSSLWAWYGHLKGCRLFPASTKAMKELEKRCNVV